jgi:hypothetical protein
MKHLLSLPRGVFLAHAAKPRNSGVLAPAAGSRRGQGAGLAPAGCGPSCRCVLDVSLDVDKKGVVTKASFESKRVLTHGNSITPLLTAKGNYLTSKCPCGVVNGLASIVTTQMVGHNLDELRNRMLLAPAAPEAIMRTLSRNLGLHLDRSNCLRVVEAAVVTSLTDWSARFRPCQIGAIRSDEAITEVDDDLCEVDFRDHYDSDDIA